MLGNALFAIGGMLFAILLIIIYFIRSKQTNIDNKLYKLLLIGVLPVILTEILAIALIYHLPNIEYLGDSVSKVYSIVLITWIMIACAYIITLGSAYKYTNLKELIKLDEIRAVIIVYVSLILISLFLGFKTTATETEAYMGGAAFYFLFLVSSFYVVLSFVVAIVNKNQLIKQNKIPIMIGAIVLVGSMTTQIIYPQLLTVTPCLVFELYMVYFVFENPDLYLIKELGEAKQKADQSNSAKTDFLSNMSHEIRTPMNAILGFSEGILNEEKFNEETAKKDIAHVYSAGSNLLEIINNILDISKIETGEEKVESKEYSIGSIVLELKSIIESRLNNTKIKFITNIDEKTPSVLIGDKTKLFQVLLNILSNSVKYTEVGKITLNISCDIKGNNAILNIKVSDTGYGIKKEDYEKLFEKFARLDTATQNEIEGTGLGLVITKRLVNIMGGDIWFESEYGAGTNFYIELSQKIADKKPIGDILIEKIIDEEHDYIDCTGYKVLLVDDNKLNLMVAEKVLSPYNFSITKIDNGKDCVNNIKEGNEYDIIFLDHMMPDMDGIEVLHILHKLEDYNIPPVVALTANAITGTREMYLKEGFDEYLPKPININDLDKLIKKYFDNKTNKVTKKKVQKTDLPTDKKNILIEAGIDVDGALSFVGNMNNYDDMLREFYNEIDDKLKQLQQAKNDNDMKNYAILVHGLKSECRFLGINNFADQAYEQEKASKEGNSEFINEHYMELLISKKKVKDIIKKYLDL